MPASAPRPDETPPTLKRALGLPLLTLYGVGVTLGAGIYVLVGAAVDEAGVHAPVAFLAAALVVAITALSYAELATRFPVSAGEAAYVEAGFGRKELTLLIGLLVALSGIVSSSAVTIGAAAYLTGISGLSIPTLSICIVLAMGLLAAWGISQSVTVAASVTLIEVGGLLLVVGWSLAGETPVIVPPAEIFLPLEPAHWVGIGSATVLAFFAFIGFEDMANVAEEVIDPVRTFPRAVLLTLGITTVLYVLTTTAVVMTVPTDKLAGSPAPLALVFSSAPTALSTIFAAIAGIATINGILIQIIMASRVIYGLADRGHLPRRLAWIAPATRTPVIATALIVAVVLALSLSFAIDVLAERTSQIVLFIFFMVNASLIRLKMQSGPAPEQFFRVPILVPVLGMATSLTLFTLAFF